MVRPGSPPIGVLVLVPHCSSDWTACPSSMHEYSWPQSCGTHTLTTPVQDPPLPSVAVKEMRYTRPFPLPLRSLRTCTRPSMITASGQVLPSPLSSRASSWVTAVTATVPPSPIPENVTGTNLWLGGHSSWVSTVTPVQLLRGSTWTWK